MRDSIYFKDDDSRLSFLFGNYITLTNLDKTQIDRIIKMRISPINISVHTMDKTLRIKMVKNKNAGEVLDYLLLLAEARIDLNFQLVICKGINDAEHLEYSLNELHKLGESVKSIAIVPAGITKYRENLYPLEAHTTESSLDVIKIVNDFNRKIGKVLVFASDEFYLYANINIPLVEYYEEFPQLDNGVGMLALFKSEFLKALNEHRNAPKVNHITSKISIATGVAAYPLIKELTYEFQDLYPEKTIYLYEIVNQTFGETVTVSGLLTGRDIADSLKNKPLGNNLLLPENMLDSSKTRFLDDTTPKELEEILGVEIKFIPNDGYDFFCYCLMND